MVDYSKNNVAKWEILSLFIAQLFNKELSQFLYSIPMLGSLIA